MPQFLISPADLSGDRFVLRGPEAFHVARVLRLRTGDALRLFDGKGGRYAGVIEAVLPDGTVEGRLTRTIHGPHACEVRLHLFLGLLKASRWDWALEKAAEIGVASLTPVLTPRTVVQLRAEASGMKMERWRRVLASACKQCGRGDIPLLEAPAHFRDAIAAACREGTTLLGWEKMGVATTSPPMNEAMARARAGREGSTRVNLFIGPEGGFSDEEVELAEMEGAHLFHLEGVTLRSETAALAACSIIFYSLGRW
jgi:16S rRNA (uracil1498-N3)-methyltransferase